MKSNIKNAAEAAKNREIYNKLADIAREVFNHVICAPGTYSVADIAKNINSIETSERVRKADFDGVIRDVYVPRITRSWKGGFSWADGYDPMKDIHTAEVGSFKCSVNGWGVFLALQKAAIAWAIPTAARPVFARKAETADTANTAEVVTFAVNKELRALAAIVDPREKLRPVYAFIHIDIRRRAAVACNGQLLRVVSLPDIETAATAADSYLIAPALLKSGKGRVSITSDGYASNGETVAPLGEGRFPNWAALMSTSLTVYKYSEAGRVELSKPTFNELKKAVKAAAKLSDRVTIAAKSYDTVATVYAYNMDHGRDITTAVKLAAPVRSSFNVVLRAAQFAKLSDVTAFYFVGNSAPVLAAASLGFYYFNPLLAEDGDKYYAPFNIAPAGENYDPLAEFAEVIAPVDDSQDTTTAHDSESEPTTVATVATVATDDTVATVAADDSQNTPAEVTVPVAEDSIETPDADSEAEALAPAETLAPVEVAEAAAPADDLTVNTNEPTPVEAIESETVAAPDSIESEHAESEREDHADRVPLLLMTIARHTLRLAAAAALLLLSVATVRTTNTLAAATDLTVAPTVVADHLAGAITTADTLTVENEAESRAELGTPDNTPRPVVERHHARENKRESHAHTLPTVTPADSIADTLTADTLTAQAATLEAPQTIATPVDTLAAGSLLGPAQEVTDATIDDSDSEADTITSDETTDDTDPVTADSESDTTDDDPAANGHTHAHGSTPATMSTPCSPSTPLAPVAPIIL